VLGEGTTATVWRVHDQVTGEPRSVKQLSPRLAAHTAVRDRFAREATMTAALNHPNIVRVHGSGEHEGVPYLVMDFVRGGTVKERIEERGPLPARIASAVIQQALHALHYAHAQGIVHRDVKPNNIMLTADGTPRLVDFGIGLTTGRDPRFVTDPGSVLGTFGYMAPEQGIDSAEVDNRADIYATGATLYAILTGRRPTELYRAADEPQLLMAVPSVLRAIVERATRYQPDDRYRTAAEMAADLAAVHESLPEVSPEEEATILVRAMASNTQVIRQQLDLSNLAPPEKAGAERRRRRREGRARKEAAATMAPFKVGEDGLETAAPKRRDVPVWAGALIVVGVIGAALAWTLS
jgi:eukaryotic-like serine/threonine-protein kinase